METETTWNGSCHCGSVQYEVSMTQPQSALVCNCSHCHAKGLMLTFVPRAKFNIIQGEHALTEYRFNKKQIAHLFCATCGVQCFAYGADQEGTETVAINLRTIENIDTDTLAIQKFNGKEY